MQPGGPEPSFMPNQTFHLFQPRIKYGVTCDGFDPTFRVRWIIMCICEDSNIFLKFLLFTIFTLSSPSAHSEMSCLGWTRRPPSPKKEKEKKTTHLWVSQMRTQRKNGKEQGGWVLYILNSILEWDSCLFEPSPPSQEFDWHEKLPFLWVRLRLTQRWVDYDWG